jgi:DNA-binding CsgD family transcriptional regulator
MSKKSRFQGRLKSMAAQYAKLYPSLYARLDAALASGNPLAQVAEDAIVGAFSNAETRQVARVQQQLGLTPTETQVALHLADGGTVASFAEIRGTSPGTVRMQLKSIFAKCGVNRQSELGLLVRQVRG